jgi:hypothetical protein
MNTLNVMKIPIGEGLNSPAEFYTITWRVQGNCMKEPAQKRRIQFSRIVTFRPVMDLTTPALLFPAISLLLLAYTNRFLALAQVIRQLHASRTREAQLSQRQIPGLKLRIVLIQYMQGFGVLSFLLCALSMFTLFVREETAGKVLFGVSLLVLAVSLVLSLVEILISTNALSVVVKDFEAGEENPRPDS